MARVAMLRAQAKINLLLRILGRERSGYHSLETVFSRLELCDDVVVRVGVKGQSLDCGSAELGAMEENLAYRAAMAYRETGWPEGFAIEITKRIPVGGGLGGGSADAGAVLRSLNALRPEPIPNDALLDLASAIGADVPFLSTDSAMALAWGRGERMLALPPLPPRDVVLLTPSFGISTAEAYSWIAEDRGDDYKPVAGELTLGMFLDWNSVLKIARNDFEPVVIRKQPLVRTLVSALRSSGASLAMLSGSGSTVFGLFDEAAAPDASNFDHSLGAVPRRTRTAAHVEEVVLTD
ncbi:MAG: 4-(cytidine 5'-diphospho)-2-C-methyl-D-erythritol kinase [Gemmatimonadaceae bacterium]|nr:4-(cytidine 5'-diphospho)-2-C-methyl-D-erythritol kinase [Gemmatimonadaceae bacterium]MDQ3517697.1 4-(cytidine 5'-diphospho)-2-C-methyl-D-erythritol kinase [Gemmatimonadota bacterium]